MARPSNLSKLSIQDIAAEIKRRQSAAELLQRRRQRLVADLAQLDVRLASLGASGTETIPLPRAPGRRRRRAVNKVSLPEALHAAMKGQKLSITEAVAAVKAAGYKTFSRNFKLMVNMMLTKHPKLFKRVSRGVYTTK